MSIKLNDMKIFIGSTTLPARARNFVTDADARSVCGS